VTSDNTRLFVKRPEDARDDHRNRYEFAPVSGKVLDAACGCGYGSKILESRGFKVIGIDIEREAVDWAREWFPGPKYYVADAQLEFPITVDWVVSFETIEHLKAPVVALHNFALISKNIVVSVPNEEVIPFRAEDYGGDKYPHKRHFTPAQLERVMKDAGWEVTGKFTQTDKRGEHAKVRPGTDGRFLIFTGVRCTQS